MQEQRSAIEMDKIGTLEEIGAKPGDAVELVDSIYSGNICTISKEGWAVESNYLGVYSPSEDKKYSRKWRIVSRAADKEPPLFRDMTPEEQGALLLAKHQGKRIEFFIKPHWIPTKNPGFVDNVAYRIAPEPEVVTVTLYGRNDDRFGWMLGRFLSTDDTHKITFTMRDGEIDDASFKSERLK